MRALVITYGFPPVAGMSPLRCVHFVRALAARGHDVVVVTADVPPGYPMDSETAGLIPDEVEVHRVASGKIFGFMRGKTRSVTGRTEIVSRSGPREILRSVVLATGAFLYRNILKSFVFPDATFEWFWTARSYIKRLVKEQEFDVVYSFAFPFSCHYLGKIASSTGNLPWIMDYGDPWSLNPIWDVPAWRKALDKRTEAAFLKQASYQVVTTGATKAAYLAAFPDLTDDKVIVSTCGYDPKAYQRVSAEERQLSKFRVVYTGIYGLANRSEGRLIDAMGTLDDTDWEIVIAGCNISGRDSDLINRCEERGVESQVHILGQIAHAKAIALQKSADLLVVWGWGGGMQIPAKIFEYIGAQRPILLITGDRHDASSQLILDKGRGLIVDDPSLLAGCLQDAVEKWRAGTWCDDFSLEHDDENSWERQGHVIVDCCEKAVG